MFDVGFLLIVAVFFVVLHLISKRKSDEFQTFPFNRYSGIWNFFILASAFFLGSHHIRHYLRQGAVWGFLSFQELFSNLNIFVVWLLLIAFSLLTYPLKKYFIRSEKTLSRSLRFFYHLSYMLFIFSWTVALIWRHDDWHFVPKGSLICQLMVLLMKIHSFLIFDEKDEPIENPRRHVRRDSNGQEVENKIKKQQLQQEEEIKNVNVEKNPNGSNELDNLSPSMGNDEFTAKKKQGKHVPTGIDFIYFLLYPTLVYEANYPRNERIRWLYILEKCFLCLGVFSGLHLISQFYILPHLQRTHIEPFLESLLTLVVPFCICVWLVFYIIFDCICNGMAELTKFSNREFYKDWWNSTTMDEFSRKWNLPVYSWLHRHVFQELIKRKYSKELSAFITFLVSSIFHEIILILCFGQIMPYLFFSQMLQVPLIILGRNLKGTTQGNFFFWAGIIVGIPLLSTLYCREYFKNGVH